MKQLLVLFPYIKDKRLNYDDFILAINKSAGQELAVRGSLKDLLFEVRDNKLTITETLTKKKIDTFGAIYIRRWKTKCSEQTTSLAITAEKLNIPVVNSENASLQSFGKITEIVAMANQGLPLPDTIISSPRTVKKMIKRGKWWLEFPLIMKSSIGTCGICNYLVKDANQLLSILEAKPKVEFVYQQFIPNDGDYRVLVTGSKPGAIIYRSAVNGDHRNNTSLGAKAELVNPDNLPFQLVDDAISAAKALGRELCGVDVLVDKNTKKHYILEVNKKTMLETGTFVPTKMKAVSDYFKDIIESN